MSDMKDRVMQVILAEADVGKGFIPDHAKNKFSDNSGNLKCPFCQQEMIIPKDDSCFGQQRCVCRNPNCEFDGWHFPVKLVSKLIRTRRALDVAKYAIKNIKNDMKKVKDGDDIWEIQKNLHDYCKTTIKKITTLEQKDK